MAIQFTIIPNEERVPRTGSTKAYLQEDNWDDWFKYSTLYCLYFFDANGETHRIGNVKIGQVDQEEMRPDVPNHHSFNWSERMKWPKGDCDAPTLSGIWAISINKRLCGLCQ